MLSTAASYGAESKKSVMVTPVQAPAVPKDIKDIIVNTFIWELNKSTKFNFISGKIYKDAFEAVMKEQGQECDAIKCVRRVADSFGINLILSTKIIKLDENTDIFDATIEDLSSGNQLGHASERCVKCSNADILDKIVILAQTLINQSENKSKPVSPVVQEIKPVSPVVQEIKPVPPVVQEIKPVPPVVPEIKPVPPVITETKPVSPVVTETKPVTPAVSEDEAKNTMITFGLQEHLSNNYNYMTAEYSLALTSKGSDALVLRVLYNSGNSIGGGLSYRLALDPPLIDTGFYLGLGVDVINEFLGIFVIPKLEFGYSFFIIGGLGITVESYGGYSVDAKPASFYKGGAPGENGGGIDYGVGARLGYGW
jgi:hypothetical protein